MKADHDAHCRKALRRPIPSGHQSVIGNLASAHEFHLNNQNLTSANIVAQSALSLETYRLCPASQMIVPRVSAGSGSGIGSDSSGGVYFSFGTCPWVFCCRFLSLISRNASSISSSRRCKSFLWAPVEYFVFRRARPGGGKRH